MRQGRRHCDRNSFLERTKKTKAGRSCFYSLRCFLLLASSTDWASDLMASAVRRRLRAATAGTGLTAASRAACSTSRWISTRRCAWVKGGMTRRSRPLMRVLTKGPMTELTISSPRPPAPSRWCSTEAAPLCTIALRWLNSRTSLRTASSCCRSAMMRRRSSARMIDG